MEKNLLNNKEDANQTALFNNSPNNEYKVLARKYRPQDFSELKGQDVLVRTITNSIKFNRLHHAFLLTGIRGIGKTTTARIIAKTINCTEPVATSGFLIPCNNCMNCIAFTSHKHPDYIEIDAASKTGVSDIREIIENSRYLPQISKYKIYVIDEVHMLSINAFNALLKTLEEPPKHVIFIFATTESQKIPLTIISRCQRFDLKMFSQSDILILLKNILANEGYSSEEKALKIIAKVASGSVRDALSILDQAINSSTNKLILSTELLSLLSISSKESVIELLQQINDGNVKEAINTLNKLYYNGIDFAILLNDLLELINIIIRHKNFKSFANEELSLTDEELKKLEDLSNSSNFTTLTIIWQFIVRALSELNICSNNYITIEMLIYKACFITNQNPDSGPIKQNFKQDTNIKTLAKEEQHVLLDNISIKTTPTNSLLFKDLLLLFRDHKELILYHHLYEDVGLISIENNILKLKSLSQLPKNFINDIVQKLTDWTNTPWKVILSDEKSDKSLAEQDSYIKEQKRNSIIADDNVQNLLAEFKDAKVTSIKEIS